MTDPFRNVGGRPPLNNEANPESIGFRYDPDTYYTRASDGRGHSHNYRINVPKDWDRAIGKVMARHSAYETAAALIRDALFHRLKYLIDHDTDRSATELMRRIEAQVELERQGHERRECEATLNNAEELLRGLSRRGGDDEELNETLHTLRLWADTVPTKYRERAENLLDHYGS